MLLYSRFGLVPKGSPKKNLRDGWCDIFTGRLSKHWMNRLCALTRRLQRAARRESCRQVPVLNTDLWVIDRRHANQRRTTRPRFRLCARLPHIRPSLPVLTKGPLHLNKTETNIWLEGHYIEHMPPGRKCPTRWKSVSRGPGWWFWSLPEFPFFHDLKNLSTEERNNFWEEGERGKGENDGETDRQSKLIP